MSFIRSTIGRKIFTAVTGLFLIFFIITHLLGNLILFLRSPDLFNRYAYMLKSMGPILYAIEIILVLAFLVHLFMAISITLTNRNAAPHYYKSANAGKPSRKTIASTTMIYSGLIIITFVIVHIITWKYGPGMQQGYITKLDGHSVRDLHRLVVETFQNEYYVLGYVMVMTVLGFHLYHAFVSGIQSLGFYHERYMPLLFTIGIVLSIVVALIFITIPIWIYFIY